MMASSLITCLQALQQYEQLSHTGLPLVSNRRFDSQSTCSLHLAQIKLKSNQGVVRDLFIS
jgi:hypothetical protein